jgi:hypothetical protein
LAGDADKPGRRKYWYFLPNRHPFTKPEIMDDSTAIVLRLAEEYLQAALPPSNLELLGRYFRTAKKVLDGTQLAAWPYKVKVIRRGPELIPPPVEENVRAAVYEALLKGKQIRAYYRSRDRSKPWGLRLHPLGLVLRDGIIYLVAVAGDHIEPAHFALHRMRKADLLRYDEARVPPGFDFESYVRDRKEFSYVVSPKPLKLKALFDQHAGYHLQESRLSGDQTIRQRTNGRWEVRATVADTEELRWWLRGFGSLVEVLAPAYLKREFQLEASALFSTYMPRKRHGNART